MEQPTSTASHAPRPKLPLFATIWEAYRFTFANLPALLSISWAWLILGAVVTFMLGWFVFWPLGFATKITASLNNIALSSIPSILESIIGASLAVTWHRFILLREPAADAATLRIDRLVGTYFLWAILLISITLALSLVLIAPLGLALHFLDSELSSQQQDIPDDDTSFGWRTYLILSITIFFIATPYAFIPTRLSLKLPAIALQREDVTARQSWLWSKGNFWRLYTGSFACFVPLGLLTANLHLDDKSRLGYALNQSIDMVIAILSGMIGITFLSLAFRHFFGADAPSADRAGTA